MDWQAILAGMGAILTGAGGCVIVIHEFRRRDRQALREEVTEMSADVTALRLDLAACRRYGFVLIDLLSQHNIDHPDPPPLHHSSIGEP